MSLARVCMLMPFPAVPVPDFLSRWHKTVVLQQIIVGPSRGLVALGCQEGGWDGADSLNCRIRKIESSFVLLIST